jgi:hypothetical protein
MRTAKQSQSSLAIEQINSFSDYNLSLKTLANMFNRQLHIRCHHFYVDCCFFIEIFFVLLFSRCFIIRFVVAVSQRNLNLLILHLNSFLYFRNVYSSFD